MSGFFQLEFNKPYPTRLQLKLVGITGPLLNTELGNFNPKRDCVVYNGGVQREIDSYYFDATYNRYLIFMKEKLDSNKIIQMTCKMVDPPFYV